MNEQLFEVWKDGCGSNLGFLSSITGLDYNNDDTPELFYGNSEGILSAYRAVDDDGAWSGKATVILEVTSAAEPKRELFAIPWFTLPTVIVVMVVGALVIVSLALRLRTNRRP